MSSTSRFNRRILFLTGIVIALSASILLAVFFFSTDQTLAQDAVGAGTEPIRQAAAPDKLPAPPPLDPPIQTPEPGQVPAFSFSSSEIEAVQFRPKITLHSGEKGAPAAANGEKPSSATTNLQKPAVELSQGPQAPYQAPDVSAILEPLGWQVLMYEDFVSFPPAGLGTYFDPAYEIGNGQWLVQDYFDETSLPTPEPATEQSWGSNNFLWIDNGADDQSAWPAAGGEDAVNPNFVFYPNNLNSWMFYGPIDATNLQDIFVNFGLWYQTEPSYDWMNFCVTIDTATWNWNCDYWSGDSEGWTDQAYWLTSYAGYSNVWLAWAFQSDSTIVDDGPFVDELYVWGYESSASATPTPDPVGQMILNGSFETGDLTDWGTYSSAASSSQEIRSGENRIDLLASVEETSALSPSSGDSVQAVGVTDASYVEGAYSAYLTRSGGVATDWLFQVFDVPAGIGDMVLDFWFTVTSWETEVGMDEFCASLMTYDADKEEWNITVDLGCMDATNNPGYWEHVVYTLTSEEMDDVKNASNAALVFELYNAGDAGSGTAGWVDFVNVFAIGSGGGGYSDSNEPNNTVSDATAISCGSTASGIIGEAAGGEDRDIFRLTSVPSGRIDIDIAADTQVPRSELDSVVYLYDDALNLVAANDDDGVSYDSYLVYTNTVAGADYYVLVTSYSGVGSLDSYYDMSVQCASSGAGGVSGGTGAAAPDANTWTVMLYLNAEDAGFEQILTKYRKDIEAFIGSKSSFLNVVILYDGPGDGDTVRYLVQPNGNYSVGSNQWNMGEVNMGHPDTLANFVSWAMDQYPAENYYLAIDDHGDGVYGISVDPTSGNDILTATDVYSALKSATHNGDPNRKIDIFDYEACLMGLAENAYDIREWVDYVVFFEQISWGLDTYPQYFQDLSADDPPITVGQRIIDRYYDTAVNADGKGYPHTISLISTSQMAGVQQAVSDLANSLMSTTAQTQINNARNSSQAFANDLDATNPARAEYIDLWDLANNLSGLAPTQAAAVRNAVDAAVVAERHASGGADGYLWDHSGVHGLSIYYPTSKSSNAFGGYPTLYQMSRDGSWDEFLDWVLPAGGRRGMTMARSEDKLLSGDAFVFKYVYLPAVLKK